ncbi:DMT family transporter [uncultured Roseovarius sp.]|jgi:drug/metabolite transporter (DMT)-like permease|uniref:DMT family transporter n=1 Tax=uncultured Roseovarius sp. TaxID=293344 RepID=UPI000C4914D0|nr:EamA family transporter [Roseovarius sp.]MBD13138.1 EamA family transporter [Roseovarius sp.]|tara:strand:- start:24 stop:941 length:918 start_codon:yes stop_codon:yes gene_type:complete
MQEISTLNWLRIGALGVIWGASFMFVSVALTGVGPFFLAAVRIVLGAGFLLCLLRVKGRKLPPRNGVDGRKIWQFALVMALFSNVLPFILLSWAQQSVASGFAGVCMAAVPLLILPLAHFLVPGERMHLRRLVGFVLGTTGVVVLIGPGAFTSTGKDLESLARLACLGAAGGYAIGSIATRLSPEVDRLALSALVLTLAAGMILPLALVVEGWPSALNTKSLLALLYLGVLPTGVAQVLLVQVNREAGPSFFSLVNYMVPVWSVILGALVLGEALPPSLLAAMTLILVGVGMSQWGALRRVFGAR